VYIRKRIGRRRNFFQKHRILVLFLAGMGACLASFVLTQQFKTRSEQLLRTQPAVPVPAPEAQGKLPPTKNERLIYPYSVIPGGVLNSRELVREMSRDKVVAQHYANFETGKANVVNAEETRFMHVSYRIGNRVFWTAKKIKILKGETLITDGRQYARTRCGNRVSAEDEQPVSEEEPAVETFDLPVLARVEVPELEAPQLPSRLDYRDVPIFAPQIPVEHPPILPYYYRPLFSVRPYDFIVPEPGTLSLLTIGLITFVTIRFTRKK